MTDIRQCWAFHVDGTRCGHPAGHPGDHAVEITWTDAECAMPSSPNPIPVPVSPEPAPAPLNTVCVACQHKHTGSCDACGCYEFIG